MNNFFLRLLTSIVMIPFFIYMTYYKDLLIIFVILFFIVTFYELFFLIKKKKYFTFFILILLILFFIFSFLQLRGNTQQQFANLVWIFIIVCFTDIGGYIIGKIFKGPKLSKWSPNKTLSGFFGSILLSQLSFIVVNFFFLNYKINYSLVIFVIQFLVCLVSISGDLFFSFIKRINNIKDYSNILPGHGGILDRIDGLICAIIFSYLLKILHVI